MTLKDLLTECGININACHLLATELDVLNSDIVLYDEVEDNERNILCAFVIDDSKTEKKYIEIRLN